MLTSNFAEIMNVVVTKFSTRTVETISSEDIRNISLMLWGYLRLLKSGFKTKADSPEVGDDYYAYLRNLLSVLTQTQTQHLHQAKSDFLEQCTQEINGINQKIEALQIVIANSSQELPNKINRCVSDIKNCTQKLKNTLLCELNESDGFKQAMITYYDCSTEIMHLMSSLPAQHKSEEIKDYLDLFQKSLIFYAQKMLYWHEIELINEQCRSYAASGELIELVTNS